MSTKDVLLMTTSMTPNLILRLPVQDVRGDSIPVYGMWRVIAIQKLKRAFE